MRILRSSRKKSKLSDQASFSVFIPGRTLKFGSNSVEGAFMAGVTDDYDDIFNLEFDKGRFFTPFESATGANRAIIGWCTWQMNYLEPLNL